ncbi:chemotaxis protein CheW [Halarsenatibacter silvermanii]|uniref:Purine-binding chemotaxis protein CheW n=1 Tax=Halarsenatibacter silvermanii TaxID=321763 RepID=A0A1G9SE43_9FIRM|nr:chemotaxis protein CheW [Halarsenatibacter silvermanii]SDM33744.1 purine-binding chemotaxis protein CheW [Halarsenatibacter silvermanii]
MPAETGYKDMKEMEEKEAKNRKQFVTFKIGTENYGILIEQVKEIIRPKRITQVPNTEEYVIGVINLRGQIVPVLNIKKKLRLEQEVEDSARDMQEEDRIITVELEDSLIGIKVDEVNEVIWLGEDVIEPPPEVAGGIRQEYLQGVGRMDDELLVLVDLKALLFEKFAGEGNEEKSGQEAE